MLLCMFIYPKYCIDGIMYSSLQSFTASLFIKANQKIITCYIAATFLKIAY